MKDWAQRFGVEMVCVIMCGGCDIGKREARGFNHPLRHPYVRFICLTVFFRERIGEIRIEQNIDPVRLQQEPTLSQPP